MEERIEGIARMGSELLVDYVTNLVDAAEKLVDNVVANASVLARDVIRDGAIVVEAALEGLLGDEIDDEPGADGEARSASDAYQAASGYGSAADLHDDTESDPRR